MIKISKYKRRKERTEKTEGAASEQRKWDVNYLLSLRNDLCKVNRLGLLLFDPGMKTLRLIRKNASPQFTGDESGSTLALVENVLDPYATDSWTNIITDVGLSCSVVRRLYVKVQTSQIAVHDCNVAYKQSMENNPTNHVPQMSTT